MRQKRDLRLFGLLLAVAVFCGCNSGSSTKNASSETSSSPAASAPTDAAPVGAAPTTAPTVATYFRIKSFKLEAEKLGNFTAPEKLDPKAKIKGKVAIVHVSSSDYHSLIGFDKEKDEFDDELLTDYGFTTSDLALSLEEIDWLVQSKCSQGKEIGIYNVGGRSIPAYALDCKVSVIDYKAPAVVAQKTFVGKELDKQIQISSDATYKNAYMPTPDIQKYIKAMVSK